VLVVLMPFVVFGVRWVLVRRTRWGLQLTACGEHPFAARSVGVNPRLMRLYALCMGGVSRRGADGLAPDLASMTAGRGFMAFAAVIWCRQPARGNGGRLLRHVQALGIRAQLPSATGCRTTCSRPALHATVVGI
jgi:simple sugar transport system permease protein